MRRKTILVFVVLAVCLMITSGVMAMTSPNYRLDWFIPMTGGGGSASSSQYATDLSIGQAVIGRGQSEGFRASLGFWYGVPETHWELFLPLTMAP